MQKKYENVNLGDIARAGDQKTPRNPTKGQVEMWRTTVLELGRIVCRKVEAVVATKACKEGWFKEKREWGRQAVVRKKDQSKGRGLK